MHAMIAGLLIAAGPIPASDAPLDPVQAIARSDAAPNRQSKLTYAVTIVSAQRTPRGVFLHSTDDYRRHDDLALRLTFPIANRLTKQLGGPPEELLKGKRLIVRGIVERHLIVNTVNGQPRSSNRIEHEIVVHAPDQIETID